MKYVLNRSAITSIAKLKDGRIFSSNYDSTIVVLKWINSLIFKLL